ncbi:hypothetical protein [Aquirufa nivalisilvae]|uniref:hypothetical protein n=1 Tax=Aquirufa nivalisilvae TaxID=2516557 RepID=UPI00137603A5|nr:hypothetical protein [Aquirufa nivalisilvae]
MKNNHTSLQSDSVNTQRLNEKKKWIEPQINAWEKDNLGIGAGGIVDGGSKTSAA